MVSLSGIRRHREEILRIVARHRARNPRLFGSVLRGTLTPGSDVDILVKLDDDSSLIDQIALMRELEQLLACPVDVVSEDALPDAIRGRVLAEGTPL